MTDVQTNPQTGQAPGATDDEASVLAGLSVLFLTADEGIESAELVEPWRALQEAGGRPVLASTGGGDVQLYEHLDPSGIHTADLATSAAKADDYVALVLPGGVANADELRTDAAAVALVRQFVEAGKPVAVVCHGAWSMVEADVVRGRTLTSWPSLQTDLRNAGAEWRDEAVVICTDGPGPIISSRKPDDLPAFDRALVEHVAAIAKA
ncbi:MAG: type 1 glutamine amidotransferase [Actinobacteria bacterium]|nr:type 1 glutamine amidotransferase [Actinomycetota bacterium]